MLMVLDAHHAACGTMQVVFAMHDNQPHRADLAKMLVHRRARRRGLAMQLLQRRKTPLKPLETPYWC